MLDNVISLSRFPLAAQRRQSEGSRRIGLGITGLADTLVMLGLHYGGEDAERLAAKIMRTISHAAYRTSVRLATEKGAFPFLDVGPYLSRPFIRNLPEDIRAGIAANGIRNSHLTAIAPAGTISLLANNISSGIEPVFGFRQRRRIRSSGTGYREYELTDYALRRWREQFGEREPAEFFVTAEQLSPQAHLKMQAALQPCVDNAISKTINVPEEMAFDEFSSIYRHAWELGLKGCTVYRPSPLRGAVLSAPGRVHPPHPGPPCCTGGTVVRQSGVQ